MTITNPFISISGGSSIGPGDVLDLGEPMLVQGVAVVEESSPSNAGQVQFEGSLDNSSWYPVVPGTLGGGPQSNATANSSPLIDGTYHLPLVARYLRARITTAVTGLGGTTPTITATIGLNLPASAPEELHSWSATFAQES